MDNHQVCTRCIMTSKADPNISFDSEGRCNYCRDALEQMPNTYFPNAEGEKRLGELLARIKNDGKGKPYDCLMGISGGLDSAYLAYLGAAKWGLRIAAVHVDDGFDTEVASSNIKKLTEKCNIELIIIKPDKKQFSELTRAYMLAGVPNLAVPQDNALFAYLHKFAKDHKIPHFLSGGNFALECILQSGNTCDVYDMANIRDIKKKYGRDKTDRLELMSHRQRYADYTSNRVIEHRPLNLIDYNRERALKELYDFCGFEYYGAKHLENYLTGFLQLYWFPKKFGVDKRTSHLSSMIISGQMTREQALAKLEEPLYSDEWIDKVIAMIKSEFDLSDEEFSAIMAAPTHQHSDYKTDNKVNIFRKLPVKGTPRKVLKKCYRLFVRLTSR